MASQFPPKKNTAFTLYFTLYKNDGTVIANPGTITKKVSIDGAAVADIAAAVTEEDTTYGQCSVVLAAVEMNGDAIWVYIKDDTTGCVPFTCTLYTTSSLHDEVKTAVDAILVDTGTTLDTLIKDIPTVAEFNARTILAADYTVVSDLGTVQTGDSFAIVNSGTHGNAAIKTETAAILADTGIDGVVVAVASKTGYALSTAGIQAIWDALTSALTTAGSIGKRLVDYLTGDIYGRLGAPAGASVSADIAAVKAETATIVADTNELQTDLTNGGRLDLLIDGILEDTGTTLPATLTTIEGKVDTVDGIVDSILADTNELQTDWKNGGRLDLLLDNCQVAGIGAITWPYTVTDGDGNPVEGCDVWVTSDVAGTNILASGTTNSSGVVTFYLDSGTVYVWRQKSGYDATNPDTETVS